MKKIVASVSLVAVGASGLHAAVLPAMTTESGKPWSVSATLRGFYDDNVSGIPNNQPTPAGFHRSSMGFEISPSLQFSFPMEQTSVSFGYVYSLKYYDNKPINSADNYDQSHQFNAALTHAFSERYQVSVRDSFVIGQEPDLLRAGNTYTTFQRISGDNLRNYGSIDFSAQITPKFGVAVGYANTLYSYADHTWQNSNGDFIRVSNTGALDELDHLIHLDLRYQLQPQTIGVVGYQFRETDYTGNQPLTGDKKANGTYVNMSDGRNARSHYGYAGVDHNFRPDLSGSFRAGVRYTDYYNTPAGQNDLSPYGMLSLRYAYLPESYVEGGFSYDYSSTYLVTPDSNGNLTLNAQSATVFASLRHRIIPKLFGGIVAQFQNSTYHSGYYNNRSDDYYIVGLNLQYVFTPNISAEVGYNYDNLDSAIGQSYDRNRFYVGVTGTY